MVESKLNKQALDRYIQSISTIIMDRFFSENSSISGQQIVELTPIKQLNFFILKVLFSQWQEETKKFKSPYFEYSNENVKQALKTLVNTLSKNISIERNSFAPLLEAALIDTLNLIFAPTQYFNKEAESIVGYNLATSFKSLSRYIKLNKEAFNTISNNLEEGNIEKGSLELSTLIHKACEQLSLEKNEVEINFFDEILSIDFIDIEEPIAEDIILEPLEEEEVITIEVEDTINEVVTEIVEPLVDSSDTLDEEFRPIEDKSESKDEKSNDENKENQNLFEKPFHATEVTKEEDEEEKDEANIQNLKEYDLENLPKEEEQSSNINEQFSSDTQTINDQFEEMEKITTVVEKHEASPVSELHSSINVNQRYMFLNDLFGGNENEYNSAIESIENCASFDDSVEHLMQNYSRKFQWNMSSDEVKELLKIIFKRFR